MVLTNSNLISANNLEDIVSRKINFGKRFIIKKLCHLPIKNMVIKTKNRF